MLLTKKLAAAALLLVVALTIISLHVESKSDIKKDVKKFKKQVGGMRSKIFGKRAVDDAEEDADEFASKLAKKSKKGKKGTTVAPDSDMSTTKSSKKKGKDKKGKNPSGKTTTTTKKPGPGDKTTTKKPGPGGTTTTKKPGSGGTTTTKKPSSGDTTTTKKPSGKGEKGGTTTMSPDAKELDKALESIGKIRLNKKVPKDDERMKVANEKWLQKQEKTAIEHMLAGIADWVKVLKQTDGKTLNRSAAKEFFKEYYEKLVPSMSPYDSPMKLLRDDHPPNVVQHIRPGPRIIRPRITNTNRYHNYL